MRGPLETLAREGLEALGRGDEEAALGMLDEQVELAPADGRRLRGHEAARALTAELPTTRIEVDEEDVVERGSSLLLRGRCGAAGFHGLASFRDGRCVALRGFGSRAEALGACDREEPVEKNLPAVYAGFSQGDIGVVMRHLQPDVRWHPAADFPEESVFRGREAVREHLEQLHADWEGLRLEFDEVTRYGDRYLVAFRQVATGPSSGVEVTVASHHVWSLEDGRAIEMRGFRDRAEAEAAARA